MADFTALKTAIQNAIKQNGNEEITGNHLQEVLLAIVTTLGDSSINDLITALGSEATTRGNADTTLQQNINAEAQARSQADGTLQQNIDAEATTRGQADTALGGRIDGVIESINAINAAIGNGYVYAGIATPSSTPTTGKVFYLALTAGTYTNFGNIAVTHGINILKYNGSDWSLDAFLGIDDAPTPSSNKLVKSGGVFNDIMTNGSAFDLTAHNNGTTYADLNAALTSLNALPAAYKKGGMSMKYVQTSDNKYVQYRFLLSGSFTTAQFTNPVNWVGVDKEPSVGSKNLVESGGILQAIVNNIVFENKTATSTTSYIHYKIEIKKGHTYNLQFSRSLDWNMLEIDTRNKENDTTIQTIFSNTFVNAGQTYNAIFTAINDASYIRFKDTKNDGAIYNFSLYTKEINIGEIDNNFERIDNNFERIDDNLSKIYVGEKEAYKYADVKYQVVKGVAYVAYNNYPALLSSENRCSVYNVLQPQKGSYITLNCGTNYNWAVQSKSQEGSQDTGWLNSGAKAKVLYNDVRISFRTSSNHPNGQNANITDADLTYLSNILINSSLLKSWKILNNEKELNEKTWGLEFKRNIVSRFPCPLIRHATRTYTKFSPNTKEGSVIAALQGMKIIENDIRRTSDGVYVLNHENDMSINFVYANGDTIPADTEYISEHTYQELIDDFKLNMYGGYSKICTLEEQLNICRQYNIGLFAEIKDFTNVDYAIEVIELCKKYLKYENFVLLVADITIHQAIRELDSKVVICECDVYWWRLPDLDILSQYNGNSFIGVNWDDVIGEHSSTVEAYITEAHKLGIPVAAWTVEGVDVSRIKQRGDICAITTNYGIDNISGNIVYEYCSMSDGIENIERLQFNNVSQDTQTKGLIIQDGGSITFTQEQVKGAGNIILDIDVDGKLSLSTDTPISGLYNNVIENGGFRIGFAEGFYTNNSGFRTYAITAVGEAKINILRITQTKVI